MGSFGINNFLLSYRRFLIPRKQPRRRKTALAQLEWNLLHRIWDFTPGRQCFSVPAELHITTLSSISKLKARKEKRIYAISRRWYMPFWCLSFIETSINYGENKTNIKMNSARYRHVLMARELWLSQQICFLNYCFNIEMGVLMETNSWPAPMCNYIKIFEHVTISKRWKPTPERTIF